MKAIPVSFEISINFECNNCGEILSLHNREIQSKIGRKIKCQGCKRFIDVPMMDIKIDEAQVRDSDNRTGVVASLKSYGYSSQEINQMLKSISDFSQEPSVLLKIALDSLKNEQT